MIPHRCYDIRVVSRYILIATMIVIEIVLPLLVFNLPSVCCYADLSVVVQPAAAVALLFTTPVDIITG